MAPKGNKIAMPLPAGPLPIGLVRPQAAASSAAASSSVPMMQPPPVGVATPMGVVPPPPPPWPKATSEQWLSKSETVETADLKRLKIGEDDATAVWPKVHCKDSLTDGMMMIIAVFAQLVVQYRQSHPSHQQGLSWHRQVVQDDV